MAVTAGLISGSFTGTGTSDQFKADVTAPGYERTFAIALSGTAVATVQLERSLDDGVTWCPLYAAGVQLKVWNYNSAPLSENGSESVKSALYRLNCTAYTSGTLNYRIVQ